MWKPRFIDSHTQGEPTRVVLDPPQELLALPAAERPTALRGDLAHLRAAVVGEPRTSDATVGAFLFPPERARSRASILFFNDVGPLGMCVHGTIGVVTTLAEQGDFPVGRQYFDTPAGEIAVTLHDDGSVSVRNVVSRRIAAKVPVVTGGGPLLGEICYGGNWFFHLYQSPIPIEPSRRAELLALAQEIQASLAEAGIQGEEGAEIDHVGLFQRRDPKAGGVHARNFVLCPGGAYDRSPCGTGTSAWLAARYADGEIQENTEWVIESVIGSRFRGSLIREGDHLHPVIRGQATIVAEGVLHIDRDDPFPLGIPK